MSDILDDIDYESGIQAEKGRYLDMSRVNDRALHFLIDQIIILVITILLAEKLNELNNEFWFWLTIFQFIYYTFFELTSNRTIGKMVRNTKIVNMEVQKPAVWQILVRNVIRLIPFECVTIFSSHRRPLHDILSKTYVVKSIKK